MCPLVYLAKREKETEGKDDFRLTVVVRKVKLNRPLVTRGVSCKCRPVCAFFCSPFAIHFGHSNAQQEIKDKDGHFSHSQFPFFEKEKKEEEEDAGERMLGDAFVRMFLLSSFPSFDFFPSPAGPSTIQVIES